MMKYISVAIDGRPGPEIHRGACCRGKTRLCICGYGCDVSFHRSGGVPQGHCRRGYGRYYRNPAGDCHSADLSGRRTARSPERRGCLRSIRTPEISYYASKVSAVPEVRRFLLETQRNMAKNSSILMDGRDIGTVILPDAPVKIFLTASAQSRAERRYKELIEKGQQVTMDGILHDINERDRQDMTRAVAPLKQADDAVLLDTSSLTLEESIAAVLHIIREKTEEKA